MAASVPLLQRCGDALRRRQDIVRGVQWAVVALYLSLLVGPVALASPALARLAEILFWGLWWPGVILSMLLFGQFWCGLFCPDGTLTEFMSRHGRGGKIPAWLRWAGWPLLIFSLLTVYEHLVDAYRSASATLLTVGGMSLLALVTGFFFGRGKRIWCRYACPGSSMFSLLARCAVFHFRVDRAAWDAAPRTEPLDCPLLLDVRRLKGNEKCSMCGRCSGHRNAVALTVRAPGQELARLGEGEVRLWEAGAILFVLIGLGYGVAHWRGSGLHGWLQTAVESGGGWLGEPVSAWLFRPAGGTGGNLGGALAALGAMVGQALALGGAVSLLLLAGVRGNVRRAAHLAHGLIPLGGLGLFLGSLEHAFELAAQGGWQALALLPWVRAAVLLAGLAWSFRIGRALWKDGIAGFFYLATAALLAGCFQMEHFRFHPGAMRADGNAPREVGVRSPSRPETHQSDGPGSPLHPHRSGPTTPPRA